MKATRTMSPKRLLRRPHLHLLPRLDQDDRAALAQLGSYAFLVLFLMAVVLVLILVLALTAGLAHHLFVWAM